MLGMHAGCHSMLSCQMRGAGEKGVGVCASLQTSPGL